MGRKKNAPVVVVRKDKRLRKGLHLAAFALTGGASGIVTAAKAGTNAAYNARTRKMAAAAEETPGVTEADHERARAAGQRYMAMLEKQKQDSQG